MSYQREPILGKARDLIASNWQGSNVNGIDTDASAPLDLTVHTRGRDSRVGDPQVRLVLIDETATPSGFAGDGSGPVLETSGLIQANCIAGSEETLDTASTSATADDVAYRMAMEVKRIWHAEAPTGLDDGAGTLEYDQIYPGQLRPLPNAERESNPASVGYLVELNYEYEDKTPQ